MLENYKPIQRRRARYINGIIRILTNIGQTYPICPWGKPEGKTPKAMPEGELAVRQLPNKDYTRAGQGRIDSFARRVVLFVGLCCWLKRIIHQVKLHYIRKRPLFHKFFTLFSPHSPLQFPYFPAAA